MLKNVLALLAVCSIVMLSHICAISTTVVRHNEVPDIASTHQTIVSLVDHADAILVDQQPSTTQPRVARFNKSKDHIDEHIIDSAASSIPLSAVTPVVQDEMMLPDAGPNESAPPVDPVAMINDSGGGGSGSEGIEATTTNPPGTTSTKVPASAAQTAEETQIPLFSEWAQKRMEEVEKEQEQDAANVSTQKRNQTAGQKIGTNLKVRTKNYASPDCGAKIIASNHESSNTRAVLTLTKDEYLLSPCTSRIWFVVELCEAVQAEHVDLANFELFSSSPRNFSVAVANRFPTRDWSQVGRFTALDERDIQHFDLDPHLFGKYVRVDIHSHYNSEHFCPISLFRVFGTSEFEAFATEDRLNGDDDDDDGDDPEDSQASEDSDNIFRSAGNAVLSIVKKAAATFVKPSDANRTGAASADELMAAAAKQTTVEDDEASNESMCICPRQEVICHGCADSLRSEVYQLLSCKHHTLGTMIEMEGVRREVARSEVCLNRLGAPNAENCADDERTTVGSSSEWLSQMLPTRYLLALCNLLPNNQNYSKSAAGGMNATSGKSIPISNVSIDESENVNLMPRKTGTNKPATTNDEGTALDAPVIEPTNDSNDFDSVGLSNEFEVDPVNNFSGEETLPTQIQSPPLLVDGSSETTEPFDEKSLDGADSKEENYIFEGDLSDKDDVAPPAFAEPPLVIPPMEMVVVDPIVDELSESVFQQIADEFLKGDPVATASSGGGSSSGQQVVEDASVEDITQARGGNGVGMTGQKVQSESVFLRLSNRVKSLERNMSLSGQYLEELSRRYKKQVEELQLTFSKTLHDVNEQHKRSHEREQHLFTQNSQLRRDLDALQLRLTSWRTHAMYIGSVFCAQMALWLLRRIWRKLTGGDGHRRRSSSVAAAAVDATLVAASGDMDTQYVAAGVSSRLERLRRKSMDGSTGHIVRLTQKRRRPSEEALNIAGTYAELMIADGSTGDDLYVEEVNGAEYEEYDEFYEQAAAMNNSAARRKAALRQPVKRTVSMDATLVGVATRKNGAIAVRRLESAPGGSGGHFDRLSLDHSDAESSEAAGSEPVLDEDYEVYVPGCDMAYNEFMPDGPSGQSTPLNDQNPATGNATPGGDTSTTSLSSNSKTAKLRRLSSPAFLKSPFGRGSSSSSSMSMRIGGGGGKKKKSGHEQTTGWEWYRLKKETNAAAAATSSSASSQSKNTQNNSTQNTKPKKWSNKSKSKSESPPDSRNHNGGLLPDGSVDSMRASSSATTLSVTSSLSVPAGLPEQKKTTGSFRRILRKVF